MAQNKKPLIILTGPTAAGKTAASIGLAKAMNCEIISADSMQVYRYMDIGSAKIMPHEMDGIRHYLVDALMPEDEFSVVRFQQMAKAAMEQIYAAGKIPLVVGGTGFYIQALLYDIDFEDTCEDPAYRSFLEQEAKERGPQWLEEQLREVDPESADAIHCHNTKRMIRALEYYKLTGRKISQHNEAQRQKDSPYDFRYFVLNRDREELYQRIDLRVDQMMAAGLLEEVVRLKNMGYDRSLVSMQGLGYKELLAYLEGECSLEEAVDTIKRSTRHFAKRQLTWFRREKQVTWIDVGNLSGEQLLQRLVQECADLNEY